MINRLMVDVLTESEEDLEKVIALVDDELYVENPTHQEALRRLWRAKNNLKIAKRAMRRALKEAT